MTTATPGRCASGNRRNSRCVTDVSHCKTSKLKLDDNSSSPIRTIQLDQESSGHQYEQSLNSPLLKSKGVIAVTAIMETLTGGKSRQQRLEGVCRVIEEIVDICTDVSYRKTKY